MSEKTLKQIEEMETQPSDTERQHKSPEHQNDRFGGLKVVEGYTPSERMNFKWKKDTTLPMEVI